MSGDELEQARRKADDLLRRLQSDDEFREEFVQGLERDPKGTLVAAGIPESATADLTRELADAGEDPEVSGFVYRRAVMLPKDPDSSGGGMGCILTTPTNIMGRAT
jgi:hypothetical protein